MERLTFGNHAKLYLTHNSACLGQDQQGREIGYQVEIIERDLIRKVSESGDSFPPAHIAEGPVCYEVRPAWTRNGQRHGRILRATYTQDIELAFQISTQLQERAKKNAVSRYAESTAYHVGQANYAKALDQAFAHDSLESAVEVYAESARQTMQAAGFSPHISDMTADIVTAAHRNASNRPNPTTQDRKTTETMTTTTTNQEHDNILCRYPVEHGTLTVYETRKTANYNKQENDR